MTSSGQLAEIVMAPVHSPGWFRPQYNGTIFKPKRSMPRVGFDRFGEGA
jgi:hypothetical protein